MRLGRYGYGVKEELCTVIGSPTTVAGGETRVSPPNSQIAHLGDSSRYLGLAANGAPRVDICHIIPDRPSAGPAGRGDLQGSRILAVFHATRAFTRSRAEHARCARRARFSKVLGKLSANSVPRAATKTAHDSRAARDACQAFGAQARRRAASRAPAAVLATSRRAKSPLRIV